MVTQIINNKFQIYDCCLATEKTSTNTVFLTFFLFSSKSFFWGGGDNIFGYRDTK